MLPACVNLQFPVHLFPQFCFGQHTGDRQFQHPGRTGLTHFDGANLDQTTRVAAVATIQFLTFFAAGELDFFGIDNDDVIARINGRRVGRSRLSRAKHGQFRARTEIRCAWTDFFSLVRNLETLHRNELEIQVSNGVGCRGALFRCNAMSRQPTLKSKRASCPRCLFRKPERGIRSDHP
jgi:hypothetical protein